jgi:hypothetical protein
LVVTCILSFADIAKHPPSNILEEMESAAPGLVIADGQISSDHLHVTNLALTGVPKRSIGLGPVLVAIEMTRFPGNQKDQRVLARGANSALLLPAKARVELRPAIKAARSEGVHHYLFDPQKERAQGLTRGDATRISMEG